MGDKNMQEIWVAGRKIHVPETTTAAEILAHTGIPAETPRALIQRDRFGGAAKVLPPTALVHVQKGDAFDGFPIGVYGQ